MKIILLRKYDERKRTSIEEIEITSFCWEENHKFRFVRKGESSISELKPNEEIIGLDLKKE